MPSKALSPQWGITYRGISEDQPQGVHMRSVGILGTDVGYRSK